MLLKNCIVAYSTPLIFAGKVSKRNDCMEIKSWFRPDVRNTQNFEQSLAGKRCCPVQIVNKHDTCLDDHLKLDDKQ